MAAIYITKKGSDVNSLTKYPNDFLLIYPYSNNITFHFVLNLRSFLVFIFLFCWSNINLFVVQICQAKTKEKAVSRLRFTLLYSALLYSTLLYSTLLYSTLLYSTPFYSTHSIHSSLLYSIYSTLFYSTQLFY